MLDISEIAKVLKPFDLPGASEIFRMPRGNPSFQSLLASARHFAEDVEPHKALFIALAMPATFVDNLEAQIMAFEAAIQSKSGGRATRVGGTSGLEIQAKSADGNRAGTRRDHAGAPKIESSLARCVEECGAPGARSTFD